MKRIAQILAFVACAAGCSTPSGGGGGGDGGGGGVKTDTAQNADVDASLLDGEAGGVDAQPDTNTGPDNGIAPVAGPDTYNSPTVVDAGAIADGGVAKSVCSKGSVACEGSSECCPGGTVCQKNTNNSLGCGKDYQNCCGSCLGDPACGGGCCQNGTNCSAAGSLGTCGANFCCMAEPEEQCDAATALQCPDGTKCLLNHSARSCSPSKFACYHPSGLVACPGEVACPGGVDFCPNGKECHGLGAGVCMGQSAGSGGYCCEDKPSDMCCCTFEMSDQYWHCVHGLMDKSKNPLCNVPWPECCNAEWTKCE